jgi:hypothetical protein
MMAVVGIRPEHNHIKATEAAGGRLAGFGSD